MPTSHHPVPTRRYGLAWALMVVGLVGFWCSRPWLGELTFAFGQIAVLMVTWKVASLLCLRPEDWSRFTRLRLLAYCVWFGMQPQQFFRGAKTPAGAPVPTVRGLIVNVLTGVALFWVAPRLLPASTPWAVRFWVALTGFCFLSLIARFDLYVLIFRAMGFAVEKLWDCPIAATSLGDFWGRRWNRLVSGLLRDVVFLPLARRAGSRVALFGVFLYSGLYHEILSFAARSGYGGPTAYFLVQSLGVAIENSRAARRVLRASSVVGRVWTFAVVVLPVGLLLQPGIVDGVVVPILEKSGVAGLRRSAGVPGGVPVPVESADDSRARAPRSPRQAAGHGGFGRRRRTTTPVPTMTRAVASIPIVGGSGTLPASRTLT